MAKCHHYANKDRAEQKAAKTTDKAEQSFYPCVTMIYGCVTGSGCDSQPFIPQPQLSLVSRRIIQRRFIAHDLTNIKIFTLFPAIL